MNPADYINPIGAMQWPPGQIILLLAFVCGWALCLAHLAGFDIEDERFFLICFSLLFTFILFCILAVSTKEPLTSAVIFFGIIFILRIINQRKAAEVEKQRKAEAGKRRKALEVEKQRKAEAEKRRKALEAEKQRLKKERHWK